MFTGIIATTGVVKAIETKSNMIHIDVNTGILARDIRRGDSVSISGACLTAESKKGNVVRFDMMKETLESTTLGSLKLGDEVNLELALTPISRMGGHYVTGHVDEVGTIQKITKSSNWVAFTIRISKKNQKYLAPKGSITVDGISLTIGKVNKGSFDIYLIPLTLELTTLSTKFVGSKVNLEMDILAKYVVK